MNENQQIEPVAKGQMSANRKGVFRKIYDDIIVPNVEELKNNFIDDVIVPQTMDWMSSLLFGMLNEIFKTPGSSSSSYFSGRYRDYNKAYRSSSGLGSSRRTERRNESRRDDVRDWEQVCFDTRSDAERVISSMKATIMDYQVVTIGDLFSFAGIESSWTDNKYGWADLSRARAVRGRDGKFYLDLPNPMAIDDDN